VLRHTTGSLGVRVTAAERWPAARRWDSVSIDGQLIRVKVSAGRIKAEYEDVARASRRTGQSLREVAFRAEALWRAEHGGLEGGPLNGPGETVAGARTIRDAADPRLRPDGPVEGGDDPA